jgi:hypothetical protein
MHKSITALATLALVAAHGAAEAVLVVDNAGFEAAQVVTFDAFDGLVTTGPTEVGLTEIGTSVILTSTPFAEVGANSRDLGDNGLWGARVGPTPTGSGNFLASLFATPQGSFTFTLAAPVAGVGGFINQFQAPGVPNQFALIAYDAQGETLETYNASVDTDPFGYNEGGFYGIHRTQADIYGFGVANGALVLDNLTLTAVPIPEPETYALMAAGLGIVGWLARRRSRVAGV